jgi:hypothetical protein
MQQRLPFQAKGQGNRISNLSEDFGEECVLPSGPLDLDAQGTLGRLLADEIEGHVAEDGEVVGAVVEAIAGVVLVQDDVEAPVQGVVSRPEGFHLRPLSERCGSLSTHTAPIKQTRQPFLVASVQTDAVGSPPPLPGSGPPASCAP